MSQREKSLSQINSRGIKKSLPTKTLNPAPSISQLTEGFVSLLELDANP
jgi:hypothetical protein